MSEHDPAVDTEPARCGLCKKPARGFAVIDGISFCHEGDDPTCFQLHQWKLSGATSPPSDLHGEEPCTQCGHDFAPHLMIAIGDDPLDGGVILCQDKDCMCYSTWGVPQAEEIREKFGDDIGRPRDE